MVKAILVTGVAGSGKSSVCMELQKRGYRAFDIEEMPGMFSSVDKRTDQVTGHDNDDLESVKQHDWICDEEKLRQLIAAQKDAMTFYCGTASNLDELLPLFNKVILLQVSPETIRKRLGGRKSGEFGNTKEVQEWVISWKDWWENHMREKDAILIDGNQSAEQVVGKILDSAAKVKIGGRVHFSAWSRLAGSSTKVPEAPPFDTAG
jgi:broad-specificity NMP kinase